MNKDILTDNEKEYIRTIFLNVYTSNHKKEFNKIDTEIFKILVSIKKDVIYRLWSTKK